jgi:mRNA-degrading endonuclease toxin of MazEF toxin-antitoxin module
MKQWDIYLYPFPDEKPHPVVILSIDEWCENQSFLRVNGLLCTSAQLNRGPKKNEVILDEADGLDWKTGVRCDFIYALPKTDFVNHRGTVSTLRRREISRKLAECFRLAVS